MGEPPQHHHARPGGTPLSRCYGVALVVSVLLMAGTFFLVQRHETGITADLALVNEQRLLARTLTALAVEAVQGQDDAFDRLGQAHALRQLDRGAAQRRRHHGAGADRSW